MVREGEEKAKDKEGSKGMEKLNPSQIEVNQDPNSKTPHCGEGFAVR